MKQLLPSLLLCILALGGQAQHTCISQLGQPAAGMAEQLENDLQRWLQQHPQAVSARDVVQIPTVVHIIWKNPQENLADSLIHRTIEMVNKDWRRQHADTVNTPAHFLPWRPTWALSWCWPPQLPMAAPRMASPAPIRTPQSSSRGWST